MEDAKIIALFWERNEQAVKETDTAYGGRLYSLSNRILNNREDAEESVSDTYMETWKSIPPKQPTYFYAFLAYNKATASWQGDWYNEVPMTEAEANAILTKYPRIDQGMRPISELLG